MPDETKSVLTHRQEALAWLADADETDTAFVHQPLLVALVHAILEVGEQIAGLRDDVSGRT